MINNVIGNGVPPTPTIRWLLVIEDGVLRVVGNDGSREARVISIYRI
jgi:hypothetical protein